jgi:hypothetical protein
MVLHIESDESLEGQHLSLLQISSVFLRNVWNFLCSFNVNSTLFFLGRGGEQVQQISHITKLK